MKKLGEREVMKKLFVAGLMAVAAMAALGAGTANADTYTPSEREYLHMLSVMDGLAPHQYADAVNIGHTICEGKSKGMDSMSAAKMLQRISDGQLPFMVALDFVTEAEMELC
jgi:hypothetical protein